jgi:glutathione synthase/RimK-type ligase-like ATP-grasp enzyme
MDADLKKAIFFVCNDPERALGLENVIENFHIICTDNSPWLKVAKENDIKFFSLAQKEEKANPVFRNSSKLLENKEVQAYIKKNTPRGTKAQIMVFKVSLRVEEICEKLGYKLLNTTSALNKKFELKISQYNDLKTLVSFFPKTIITTLNKVTYSQLKRKLGEKIVLQYNRGHTGNSTVFVNDEKDFTKERKSFPNRLARIAEYVEGDIYTLNACVTRFGIVYGGISQQITGIEELTSKEGGTVGNDWQVTEKITKKAHFQIKEILERLHKELFNAGYKGLFGVDLVITKRQRVYLIEINSRQPASIPMHTKLMLNEEFIPLQAFHIAEFLCEENASYIRFLNKYFHKGLAETNISRYIEEQNKLSLIPIEASQIFLRNTKKYKQKILKNLEQGVYVYNEGTFTKTGEGYNIQDIIPGEYLILSTQIEQYVSPDHEVLRIQCLENALDEKGKIKKKMKKIISKANKKIRLSK